MSAAETPCLLVATSGSRGTTDSRTEIGDSAHLGAGNCRRDTVESQERPSRQAMTAVEPSVVRPAGVLLRTLALIAVSCPASGCRCAPVTGPEPDESVAAHVAASQRTENVLLDSGDGIVLLRPRTRSAASDAASPPVVRWRLPALTTPPRWAFWLDDETAVLVATTCPERAEGWPVAVVLRSGVPRLSFAAKAVFDAATKRMRFAYGGDWVHVLGCWIAEDLTSVTTVFDSDAFVTLDLTTGGVAAQHRPFLTEEFLRQSPYEQARQLHAYPFALCPTEVKALRRLLSESRLEAEPALAAWTKITLFDDDEERWQALAEALRTAVSRGLTSDVVGDAVASLADHARSLESGFEPLVGMLNEVSRRLEQIGPGDAANGVEAVFGSSPARDWDFSVAWRLAARPDVPADARIGCLAVLSWGHGVDLRPLRLEADVSPSVREWAKPSGAR